MALLVCLVLAATAAAVVSTFLGRTLVEQNRVRQKSAQERAGWRALGELELAKNIIYTSESTDGRNDAICDALAGDPSFIENTSVLIEPAGPNRWYRLTSVGSYEEQVGTSVTFVRDGTSYVAYNYYVESDSLGLTGQTEGRVHTNETVEFYFAGGEYGGPVSAGCGFEYRYGAEAENTSITGEANPYASSKELLQQVSFEELASTASYTGPENVDAEVRLLGEELEVALLAKSLEVEIPQSSSSSRYVGLMLSDNGEWLAEVDDSGITEYAPRTIGGELISTESFKADGVFYSADRVTWLGGDLNGHVTLVSEHDVLIRDNVRYLDSDGQYAFLNGSNPDEEYLVNPSFERDHSFGVISKGDVLYALDAPVNLEINGVLISTQGTVGMEGVGIDGNGDIVVEGDLVVLNSLRRLGSILCFERPVSTVLSETGTVDHGFRSGQGIFDDLLLYYPPPSFPNEAQAMFSYSHRHHKGYVLRPGPGVFAAGVVPLEDLEDMNVVEGLIQDQGVQFPWAEAVHTGSGGNDGAQQGGDDP